MFYCTPKGTLTALPVIHASYLAVPHTWEKLGKTLKKIAKTEENQKTLKKPAETKKTLEKPAKTLEKTKKNNQYNIYIYIHISRLFGGGGPCQDSLKIVFLVFFCFLFGFPRFLLSFWFFKVFAGFSNVFLVLVTFSHLHFFVHWPFGVFMSCRNQSFNHCSYEHTGSEDQDCAFQF